MRSVISLYADTIKDFKWKGKHKLSKLSITLGFVLLDDDCGPCAPNRILDCLNVGRANISK